MVREGHKLSANEFGYLHIRAMNAPSLRQFMLVANLKLFAKKLPQLWDRDHLGSGSLESDIACTELFGPIEISREKPTVRALHDPVKLEVDRMHVNGRRRT